MPAAIRHIQRGEQDICHLPPRGNGIEEATSTVTLGARTVGRGYGCFCCCSVFRFLAHPCRTACSTSDDKNCSISSHSRNRVNSEQYSTSSSSAQTVAGANSNCQVAPS